MAEDNALKALEEIAAEIEVCTRCDLHQGAHRGVPGSGNPHAEMVFVGEAPSYFDDRRGYPFSGPSGEFLNELLGLAGLSRGDVYLTNLVKHRVPDGRELLPGEIAACAGYLTREIEAVNPLVIVALGRGALARFLPGEKISRVHGQAKVVGGRVVVAMYNPAAALHQEALRQTVVDDFTRALPVALAEARRLAAEGKLGGPTARSHSDEPPPQQLSLF